MKEQKEITVRERDSILRLARKYFFEAMLAGYAGNCVGVRKEKTQDGCRVLTWPPKGNKNGFVVIDRYYVTPSSEKSAGTITIFFNDKPIWWMSYCGEYQKGAIKFLKKVLVDSYKKEKFNGGRGPSAVILPDDSLYVNECTGRDVSSFREFDGYEYIRNPQGHRIGYHQYLGMSLI